MSLRIALKKLAAIPDLPPLEALWASSFASMASVATVILLGIEPFLWYVSGAMFVVMLLLMTGDVFTSYYALDPKDRKDFPLRQEATGKLLLVSLVVMSLLLDLTIYLAARALPGEYRILTSGFLFVTVTSMVWMIGGHISLITGNVARHKSVDQVLIPPPLSIIAEQIQWMLRNIRRIDRRRAEAVNIKMGEDRWIDNLTEEEIDQLVAVMLGKRKKLPESIIPEVEDVERSE